MPPQKEAVSGPISVCERAPSHHDGRRDWRRLGKRQPHIVSGVGRDFHRLALAGPPRFPTPTHSTREGDWAAGDCQAHRRRELTSRLEVERHEPGRDRRPSNESRMADAFRLTMRFRRAPRLPGDHSAMASLAPVVSLHLTRATPLRLKTSTALVPLRKHTRYRSTVNSERCASEHCLYGPSSSQQ